MKRASLTLVILLVLSASGFSLGLQFDHVTLEGESLQDLYGPMYASPVTYDNLMFAPVAGNGILIYDVSNPASPVEIAQIAPLQSPHAIAYNHPYLYTYMHNPVIDEYEFVIFDLSDPTQPQYVTTLTNLPFIHYMSMVNGYLYASDYHNSGEGFRVYDVSNPTNPVLVYHDPTHDMPDIAIYGNLLAAPYSTYLALYDITNPALPILLATGSGSGGGSGSYIEMTDGVIYYCSGGYFQVFDISDPNHIQYVQSIDNPGVEDDLAIVGNYLCVGGRSFSTESASYLFDISNPLQPVLTDSVGLPLDVLCTHPNDETTVYGFSRTSPWLTTLNIDDPQDIQIETQFGHYAYPYLLKQQGTLLATGSYHDGAWLTDWQDPDNPVDVQLLAGCEITDLQFVGSYLYCAVNKHPSGDTHNGLYVFDISTPDAPVQVAYLQKLTIHHFEASGAAMYLGADGVMTIYNVTDPSNPTLAGSLPEWGAEDEIQIEGTTLYRCDVDNGALKAYSIQNPLYPLWLDTLPLHNPLPTLHVTVNNSRIALCYVGYPAYYLYLIDAQNPAALTVAETISATSSDYINGAEFDGDLLYVTRVSGEIEIHNVETLAEPVQVGGLAGASFARKVVASGTVAYSIICNRLYKLGIQLDTPVLEPPTGFAADLTGALVTLTWEVPIYDPPLVLEGYNVYRDGELIATTGQPSQIDLLSASGSYEYTVTAVYNNGESDPAGPAIVSFTQILRLTLDPYEPYLQVPPVGGPVYFHATLENLTGSAQTLDAWTLATTPGGNNIPLRQYTLQLDPHETFTRNWLLLTVPAQAPAGTYTFEAFAGNHPDLILATDQFQFTKAAAEERGAAQAGPTYTAGIASEGWMLSGWATPNPAPHDGPFAGSEMVDVPPLPTEFAVAAYPNPFNERATITLSLPESGEVTAQIYDITGRRVATLLSGSVSAGTHQLAWNADGLASGVYFLRVQSGGRATAIRKLALVR